MSSCTRRHPGDPECRCGRCAALVPQQVTFTAHPIETAPKDRSFMAYMPASGLWSKATASTTIDAIYVYGIAYYVTSKQYPTHWAEIEEMKP